MTRTRFAAAVTSVLVAAIALPAAAGNVEVRMLDRSTEGVPKVFRPAVVRIDPGDTVHFVARDFGHDLESIDALRPSGVESFDAPKNVGTKFTFEKEGVHVYHCKAHKTMGMVGVVVVGDPEVNLEKIADKAQETGALSEQGKERLARMLERVRHKFASNQ